MLANLSLSSLRSSYLLKVYLMKDDEWRAVQNERIQTAPPPRFIILLICTKLTKFFWSLSNIIPNQMRKATCQPGHCTWFYIRNTRLNWRTQNFFRRKLHIVRIYISALYKTRKRKWTQYVINSYNDEIRENL